MHQNNLMMQEEFDSLLSLFSSNREEAGAKYEEIRQGLMRYFFIKGCAEPETLADETISRASEKFATLKTDQNFQHQKYFYAVAAKVFLEYLKKEKKAKDYLARNRSAKPRDFAEDTENNEKKHFCLEKCLTEISVEEKELVIEYFSKDGGESILHRRKLAKRLDLRIEALHVRIFRLKKILRSCVEKCLN